MLSTIKLVNIELGETFDIVISSITLYIILT